MKRFLLFYGSDYYTRGGWWDMQGDHNTVEEAEAQFEKDVIEKELTRACTWFHIIDSTTGKCVIAANESCYGR